MVEPRATIASSLTVQTSDRRLPGRTETSNSVSPMIT
jgi:hypothetical protein